MSRDFAVVAWRRLSVRGWVSVDQRPLSRVMRIADYSSPDYVASHAMMLSVQEILAFVRFLTSSTHRWFYAGPSGAVAAPYLGSAPPV